MANYSIDFDSTDILVSANYSNGFSAINSINFGGCNVSLESALSGNSNLTAVTNGVIKNTSANSLFKEDFALSNVEDLTLEGVTDLTTTFQRCYSIESLNIDCSEVTTALNAFGRCYSLTSLSVGDLSKLANGQNFVYGTSIPEFNHPETSALTNATYMFSLAFEVTSVTLNTTNVTDMTKMFCGAPKLEYLNMIGSGASVTSIENAFCGENNQNDGKDKNNKQPLKGQKVAGPAIESLTFDGASLVNALGAFGSTYEDPAYANLSIKSVDFGSCPNLEVGVYMFANCTNLSSVTMNNLAKLNGTKTVTVNWSAQQKSATQGMFSGCTSLVEAKLGGIGGDLDLTACPLNDESTTYIADNAQTVNGATIKFNESVLNNENYATAYATLTGKGFTVTPVAETPAVATLTYSDVDGTGEDGIDAIEA